MYGIYAFSTLLAFYYNNMYVLILEYLFRAIRIFAIIVFMVILYFVILYLESCFCEMGGI